MSEIVLSLDEMWTLVVAVLVAHDTSEVNAACVADALVAAEADGQKGHGMSRLSSYASQAASGKVDGRVVPEAEDVSAAALRIDAKGGFAFPAMALAIQRVAVLAANTGIAVAAVRRSHHFGQAGYHVERLAEHGLIGLLFGNSPKAIAPWGGRNGVFGTNPIAFAAPRRQETPLLIDLSLSKVARGKVMLAARRGEPIPEGWALDVDGRPTTDADAALAGTMVPMGDAKGAALVMMVEILAAALTGANFGFEASSFFDAEGKPPGVGQTLLAIDPERLSGGSFAGRLETLLAAVLEQPGTRLPGARKQGLRAKARADGVALPRTLVDELRAMAPS